MFNITLDYTGKKYDLKSDIIINVLELKESHLRILSEIEFYV